MRPFTTVSAVGGVSQLFGSHGWHAGADFELGGSYFFSPHVSLGGSGALRALYTHSKVDFGGGDTRTQKMTSIGVGFLRLLGAVYF